ncbi:50S ribosomal protein L5 [Candidatus Tremblaya princeps]|uniref:50S ribosomal protein L5 n=1 Tax=Tremblaya princeps TaxID=189385 RepID=A0A143WNA8_TREPR|nr:50S ribosomal protein L5 [Candidatus Tremblaya princeps]
MIPIAGDGGHAADNGHDGLYRYYAASVAPRLLGPSAMEVPRLWKATLSMGVGRLRGSAPSVRCMSEALASITGQRPMPTRSSRSISNFKVRRGDTVGLKVTLRSRRMHELTDRLIHLYLPRVRDFRGVPASSIDAGGSISIGVRSLSVFNEVEYTAPEASGLCATLTVRATCVAQSVRLLRRVSFPLIPQ